MATSCRKYLNDVSTGRYGVKQPLSFSAGISSVTSSALSSFAYRNTSPYYYKGTTSSPIPVSEVVFTIVHTGAFTPTSTSFWLSSTEANVGNAPGVSCNATMLSLRGNMAIADWTITSPAGETKTLYVLDFNTSSHSPGEIRLPVAEFAKALVGKGPEFEKFQVPLKNAPWIKEPTLEGGAAIIKPGVVMLPPGARVTFHVHYVWDPAKRMVVAASGKVATTPDPKDVVFEFSQVTRAVELLQLLTP